MRRWARTGGQATSTAVHPLPHRVRRPRRALLPVAALVAAATVAVAADGPAVSPVAQPPRPELQRILDGLVTGPAAIAPGAAAYVAGPHGAWLGSAGTADPATGERMRPDARMRLDSVSKLWLTAVILELAQERKLGLDDTVERWLPGLLRRHGTEVTIRQLITDTSGLIDDNDLGASPAAFGELLARVEDDALRRQLRASVEPQVVAALADRFAAATAPVSPLLVIRLAAWQPPLFPPGSRYHHSNVGWNVAGLVAARAGGAPLPVLYRERLFRPLGLRHTAYDPQGPIAGPHARGHLLAADGTLTETTGHAPFKGADAAIVSNARETARFLTALVRGDLAERWRVAALFGGGNERGCARGAHEADGAGFAFKTNVVVGRDGDRVAVLLLNGRSPDRGGDARAAAAARRLYCAG